MRGSAAEVSVLQICEQGQTGEKINQLALRVEVPVDKWICNHVVDCVARCRSGA